MPAFKVVPASGGYRAHFLGDNGKLVWWTEVYEREAGAQHAIDLIRRHAATAPVLRVTRTYRQAS